MTIAEQKEQFAFMEKCGPTAETCLLSSGVGGAVARLSELMVR